MTTWNNDDAALRIIRAELNEGHTSWGRAAVGVLLERLDAVTAERDAALADVAVLRTEMHAITSELAGGYFDTAKQRTARWLAGNGKTT